MLGRDAPRQLEDRSLGMFSACQAQLVYHDWYDARKTVLEEFSLIPR